MTGMYQTSIGAHNHRSHRDDGFSLPDGVRLLTGWLGDAGYFSANVRHFPPPITFRGTAKTDWNFTPPARSFDSDRWADLKSHQPFYFYCLAGLNQPNRFCIISFHNGVARVGGRSWNGDTSFDSNRC